MADERIQYSEEMVGAGHPTKADTLNRLSLVEHYSDGTHRHKRELDLREFLPAGFVTDGSADYTAEIEDALSYLEAAGGGKLVIPEGTWAATRITRRKYVSIAGVHQRRSKLLALPSSEEGFLQLAQGPVLYSHLEDLAVWGGNGSPANAGQWGMKAEAVGQVDSPFHGGEWYSNHRNIEVSYFDNGIWYKGGYTGTLLPMQFITHQNVSVKRDSNSGVCLELTGQVGQFVDISGRYDGQAKGQGTNIVITKDTGTNQSYSLNFLNTTSQLAEFAFDITWAFNLNIYAGHFEELYRAIRLQGSSRNINIRGCHFANAGSDGAGGGYIVGGSAFDNAFFGENYILGSYDKVVSVSNHKGIKLGNNFFTGPVSNDLGVGMTSGVTKQLSVGESGNIDSYLDMTIFVNNSATVITQINSFLTPGEMLCLKAHSGTITLGTGANISLGGASSVTVPQDAWAILLRIDLGSLAWVLVNVARASEVSKLAPGTVASPTYVQAELQSTMNKVDSVIDALKTAGLMK